MELIDYLNKHFLSRAQLLEATQIDEATFLQYQQDKLMPAASYVLKLDLQSDSFFGEYKEQLQLEYYAKGYTAWLGIVRSLTEEQLIYDVFSSRYQDRLILLKSLGFESNNPKMNDQLFEHIREEWEYFIQGVYGLCTKSGLPEDIAAKELAVILINELTEKESLAEEEVQRLSQAVNLLDRASSGFAPHERLQSSRHRLIDEVRRKYRLAPLD